MLSDLDVLFPENDVIKFKDKSTKQEYTVEIFVCAELGELLLDNLETLQKIFPDGKIGRPKLSKELYNLCFRLVARMCQMKYPEIDEDWIRKNISLPKLFFIMYKMINPVLDFLNNSGLMGMVTPVKKPEK